MKKLSLLFGLLLSTSLVFSQVVLNEDFSSGQMPPAGWSIDAHASNWSIRQSANAGGQSPEAGMSWSPEFTGATRLISPVIDLTGNTIVLLQFRHMIDHYSGNYQIGIATRSNNGAWTSVYEIQPTGSIGPLQIDIDISNADVGSSNFQMCFYLTGNMFNINYVRVDDMVLYNPLTKDAALIALMDIPSQFSQPIIIKGALGNTGITTIGNLDIEWQLDDGPVHTTHLSGLWISTQESIYFTCNDLVSATIGPHTLKVWINNVNGSPDDYPGNDTLSKDIYRISYYMPKKPVFEEFTSSTCNPCASFNAQFVPWCATNEDNITLVKYQMNWPGVGDPYYTAEGGVRGSYYNISYVPGLICDGAMVFNTNIPDIQNLYEQEAQKAGMMKISATHSLNGQIITIDASILPFSDISDCMVQIVVMEKETHNNASTNGETTFEHVMMKMIPDANGSPFSFNDRVPVNFTYTMDLSGTHVEEWDDLIVAVFIQNIGTKEIYQSAYSMENAAFNTEARLSSIIKDGQTIAGFSPDIFSYTVTLPLGTLIVPDLSALPIDTNEIVIIIPAGELPGITSIDVYAEDLMTHNHYNVNFILDEVGLPEKQSGPISVLPNPSAGTILISNAEHSVITVSSADGILLKKANDYMGSLIDLRSLPCGVYLLSIQTPDLTIIKKKIVLTH